MGSGHPITVGIPRLMRYPGWSAEADIAAPPVAVVNARES